MKKAKKNCFKLLFHIEKANKESSETRIARATNSKVLEARIFELQAENDRLISQLHGLLAKKNQLLDPENQEGRKGTQNEEDDEDYEEGSGGPVLFGGSDSRAF
jgi:hypothetical protein